MSVVSLLKKFTIVIVVILALLLTRLGISYMWILLAIGLIISYMYESKSQAVLTGMVYAILSYLLSFLQGVGILEYIPSTEIPVNTTSFSVGFDLVMGAVIPIIVAIIICGITSIIGSNIAKAVHKFNSNENTNKNKPFDYHERIEKTITKTRKEPKTNKVAKPTKIKNNERYISPIEKAKLKNKKE